MTKFFVSAGQWVSMAADGATVVYYDGVHRGTADSLPEALECLQARYDAARGIVGRPHGQHVYGSAISVHEFLAAFGRE